MKKIIDKANSVLNPNALMYNQSYEKHK